MNTENGERAEIKTLSRKEGATVLARLEGDGERYEVRKFVEEDAEGLARLFDILGLKHRGVESFKARAAEMWAQDLVAENDEGAIVGRVRFEYTWPPYGEVVNVGVDPKHRRKGVGGLLVRGCLELAKAVGVELLHLQADLDNPASHRLYARNGFIYAIPASRDSRGMVGLLHVKNLGIVESFLFQHPFATVNPPRRDSRFVAGTKHWLVKIVDPLWRDRLALHVRGIPGQVDMPAVCGWGMAGQALHWEVVCYSLNEYVTPGSEVEIQMSVDNLPISERGIDVSVCSCYPPFRCPLGSEDGSVSLEPGQGYCEVLRTGVPGDLGDRIPASTYPNIPITCQLRIDDRLIPVTASTLVPAASLNRAGQS